MLSGRGRKREGKPLLQSGGVWSASQDSQSVLRLLLAVILWCLLLMTLGCSTPPDPRRKLPDLPESLAKPLPPLPIPPRSTSASSTSGRQ